MKTSDQGPAAGVISMVRSRWSLGAAKSDRLLGAFAVAAGLLGAMTVRPVFAAASDGAQATYSAKCAMCHGADGSGNTVIGKSAKIPDLRSAPVQSQTDAQLQDIVGHGNGVMPAFGSSMGNGDIHSMVLYLRQLAKGK